MTSRERVLAAIAHQDTDKIPVDLSATPSSGISAIAYSNLLKEIGKNNLPVRIYDVVQQLAQPDDSVLDMFEVDVIDIGRIYNRTDDKWKPTVMSNGGAAYYPDWFHPVRQEDGSWLTFDDDGKRVLAKMPAGAPFFDQVYFPYENGYPGSYKDFDKERERVMWARYPLSPWDYSGEPDFYKQLRKDILNLRQHTDKALLLGIGCNLFEWGAFMRRMDNFLMDLLCDQENVAALLDQFMERHMATLEKVCASVGDIVDIIKFGDDLGMITGPFMDTGTYQKLFKPRHKMLCDYVKANSSMHTYLHSCGSISSLMPDLIEAGIEIFNPVQTNAYGMDPVFLKKEFGKDCTFWGGGIENVGILNNGSKQQIRDQVFERMEIFSEGGGYVFNTIHNILPDVPAENIIAMFEAVNDFNKLHLEKNKSKKQS
ncbi:MAG: methyltransferase [Bacteroidales bacterium]|jgi:uroporphyrinogen decarboxylase|nr:methyltransferase [Bacteroidales bacterium]